MPPWHIALETQTTGGALPLLKIFTHTHARTGGLNRMACSTLCCVCVCALNLHTSLNTLHRDAWAGAMLSDLIQPLRYIHFLQYLKHIRERGGAKAFAIINHRVEIPAERLAIWKWILCNHLGGRFFFFSYLLRFELWSVVATPTAPRYPLINIPHESRDPEENTNGLSVINLLNKLWEEVVWIALGSTRPIEPDQASGPPPSHNSTDNVKIAASQYVH